MSGGAHWLRYDRCAHWLEAEAGSFGYAVLRRAYAAGNSVEGYARKKLRRDTGPYDHVAPHLDMAASDFLVPPWFPDRLSRPSAVWAMLDGEAWAGDLALLLSIEPRGFRTLGLAFRAVRDWAQIEFADTRSLPALVVQHAPARIGHHDPAHVHVVAAARAMNGDGPGAFSEFVRDDRLATLAPSWTRFVATLPGNRR